MHLPAYQRNPEFNPKLVTQLLDNYRSHPAILSFSNDEFYDGKLRAKLPEKEALFAYYWSKLPNKDFPVLLHSVKAECAQVRNGFSWYNNEELKVVVGYVNSLLDFGINGKPVQETDIGIVSPYKAQRDRLCNSFATRKGIEIGTSEYYQGREKKIIIISTVRSGDISVGFLKDEKRLNVVLTRAKSLLILVCNPETMQKDPLWRKFIKFCRDNNACVGEEYVFNECVASVSNN